MKLSTLALTLGLTLASACATNKAIDSVLLPRLKGAWPAVQDDINVGIADALATGAIQERVTIDMGVSQLDHALQAQDRELVATVPWSVIRPFGDRGIKHRTEVAVPPEPRPISHEASVLLTKRLIEFSNDIEKIQGAH